MAHNSPHHPDDGHDHAPDYCRKEERHAPVVDYTSRPYLAERDVANVIKKVVNEGGHMLYEHYLERKSFPFAAEASIKAVVASTQMCFVPCEDAEDLIEEIEEEPQPASKDAWMRLMLPKKDDSKMRSTFASSKDSGFSSSKYKRRQTKILKDAEVKEAKAKKEEKTEGARSWSIEEDAIRDREEDKYRDQKTLYDVTKREKEKRRKDAQKASEENRIRLEAMHKEMDERPHTFDLNGNVMWVEAPNYAKLPSMAETVVHNIKKDKFDKSLQSTRFDTSKTSNLQGSTIKFDTSSPSKPKGKKRKTKKNEATEFPDGFIRLKHEQPPILETLECNAGVSIEHKGKSKAGPSQYNEDGKMGRMDYIRMTQRQISGDTQLQFSQSGGVRAVGGNSGNPPGDTSPTGQKDGSPKGSTTGPSRSESLPALAKGRPPAEGGSSPSQAGPVGAGSGAGAAKGDAAALAGKKDGKAQPSPMAPPMHTRVRKFDAIGQLGRPPRLHPPFMGKLDVYGPKASQPPLGATMGHGLLRTENSVEEFFFPPFAAESPNPGSLMPRSKSDTYLLKDPGALARLPPLGAPASECGGDELSSRSPNHGSIITEPKSPAYRNVRKQLFPRDGDILA